MTGRDLIAEGERLARPCVLLRDDEPKDRLAAAWGGPGIATIPSRSLEHRLTIDCRFLPAGLGPTEGCLSVYVDDGSGESGTAVHDRSATLAVPRGAVPLFAADRRSLPPIDGVFRFGSEAVQAWLASNGWQPDWGYNDNFKDPKPVEEYERAYQAACPLYTGDAHAVLGGWHFPWPDGDWEDLIDSRLLVWTIADAEPWVEVWADGDGFRVMQRIT